METLNIFSIIILMGIILYEIFLIITRNRKIKKKGTEDFFTFALVVFFTTIILPIQKDSGLTASLRNVLLYVAIFGTAGIRKGFSEVGLAKSLFTIPWSKFSSIEVEETDSQRFIVWCKLSSLKFKLIFHRLKLTETLEYIASHYPNVKVQSSLINRK